MSDKLAGAGEGRQETVDHSPLPWTFTYFTKPNGSEIKTPKDVADTVAHSAMQCDGTTLWGVTLDDKDAEGRTLVICYTGNGPHSEANAKLIVAAVNALNITRPAEDSASAAPEPLECKCPAGWKSTIYTHDPTSCPKSLCVCGHEIGLHPCGCSHEGGTSAARPAVPLGETK